MSVRADLRNIATIERLSREILKQCEFYRRNSTKGDDSLRFLVLQYEARKLLKTAQQGGRRWEREHRP